MNRVFYTILFLILGLLSLTIENVSADVGPKPTVTITVIGMDENDSFEVLAKDSCTGFEPSEEDLLDIYYYKDEFPTELYDYNSDGYCSFELLGDPNGMRQISSNENEQEFTLYYYPPTTFKLAIVTEEGYIITSKAITRTRFDSNVVWDLSDVTLDKDMEDVGTISGDICIGEYDDCLDQKFSIGFDTVLSTVIRVIITLVVELGILFLFQYKLKKQYKIAAITNLCTQIVLNIVVIYLSYKIGLLGALLALLLGEIFVVLAESIVYVKYLDEHSKLRAFMYALVANGVTIYIGMYLLK